MERQEHQDGGCMLLLWHRLSSPVSGHRRDNVHSPQMPFFVRWHLMSPCLHHWHILWNRCSLHLPTLCATGTSLLEDCFPNPSSDGKGWVVLLLLFVLLLICLETLLAQNLAQLLMKKGRSAHVERASRVLNYRLMLLKHNYLGHCYQLFFPLGNKALYDILCNPFAAWEIMA